MDLPDLAEPPRPGFGGAGTEGPKDAFPIPPSLQSTSLRGPGGSVHIWG